MLVHLRYFRSEHLDLPIVGDTMHDAQSIIINRRNFPGGFTSEMPAFAWRIKGEIVTFKNVN